MIKSIIYWSNYGSTQRYAELLSKVMGIPASPLHNAGASDGEAFYLGCVMDGRIKGYGRAAGRFRIAAVCAVGLEEKRADTVFELRRNTGIVDSRIRIFYARGALTRTSSALYTGSCSGAQWRAWREAQSMRPFLN